MGRGGGGAHLSRWNGNKQKQHSIPRSASNYRGCRPQRACKEATCASSKALWTEAPAKKNYGHTFMIARVWINRVRRTWKINISLSAFAPEIWSRETDSAVPSHVSLLLSILRLNPVLPYDILPEFRGGASTECVLSFCVSGTPQTICMSI